MWRQDLDQFDNIDKPAAIGRHREPWQVDRRALDDATLAQHLDACRAHHQAMLRLHHRNNMAVMVPVGDFLAHTAAWCGRPPELLMALLAGSSPISGSRDPEMAPAVAAIAADPAAKAVLTEARQVYRLRDERGVYGDISAGGILRHALLATAECLLARGALHAPDHVFDATVPEVTALREGAASPPPTTSRPVTKRGRQQGSSTPHPCSVRRRTGRRPSTACPRRSRA